MGIIRRIKKLFVSRNPDNTFNNLGGTDEIHELCDDDGSMESTYIEETPNHTCGCFAPPGGRCGECGVISCVRCHRHCGDTENPSPLGCGKPLCREHCHYITCEDGKVLPFCASCSSKISRKKFKRQACRILLSPFVQMEENTDEK